MRDEEFAEMYHGFHINSHCVPRRGDYLAWHFTVQGEGSRSIFRLLAKISGSEANYLQLGDDRDLSEFVHEAGLRRVRGLIDLDRFHIGDNLEYVIGDESITSRELTDHEVQLDILRVLDGIRRRDPVRHTFGWFDAEGFCTLLGIEHVQYLRNALLLKEERLVADSLLEQRTIEKGGVHITAKGVRHLERKEAELSQEEGMIAMPEQQRDYILKVLAESDRAGYHDLSFEEISDRTGLANDDVEYHVEQLASEGYVSTDSSTFGRASARLLAKGKRRVREGYRPPMTSVAGAPSQISIVNSTVTAGAIISGSIDRGSRIVSTIQMIAEHRDEGLASALREINNAITSTRELDETQRTEAVELLEEICHQATLAPQERVKPSVLRSTLGGLGNLIGAAGSLAQIWSTWGPQIRTYFGL